MGTAKGRTAATRRQAGVGWDGGYAGSPPVVIDARAATSSKAKTYPARQMAYSPPSMAMPKSRAARAPSRRRPPAEPSAPRQRRYTPIPAKPKVSEISTSRLASHASGRAWHGARANTAVAMRAGRRARRRRKRAFAASTRAAHHANEWRCMSNLPTRSPARGPSARCSAYTSALERGRKKRMVSRGFRPPGEHAAIEEGGPVGVGHEVVEIEGPARGGVRARDHRRVEVVVEEVRRAKRRREDEGADEEEEAEEVATVDREFSAATAFRHRGNVRVCLRRNLVSRIVWCHGLRRQRVMIRNAQSAPLPASRPCVTEGTRVASPHSCETRQLYLDPDCFLWRRALRGLRVRQ